MEQFEEETGDESLKVVQGDYADEYYYTEEYVKYLERLLMETHENGKMLYYAKMGYDYTRPKDM